MSKNLVIVESPAKAKTICKYLGKDFTVLASYGHVRDLLPKKGSVDPDNNFNMTYSAIEKNKKHVDQIIKELKKADSLYLATDPDREGEAISWHIVELLKSKKMLKNKSIFRVAFHQITKDAIKDAVKNPREISMDLVNSQQARRALDYLVGFNLSPLLWKKIRRGLSAGRVQSPALRMIVEREDEIEKFKSQEYWSIDANLLKAKQNFNAKLSIYNDDKVKQFTITNEKQATKVKKDLLKQADGQLVVEQITKKSRKRNPVAPFITSTLQQEAIRKLGFTARKAMQIAQQLYEGITIGKETDGLITYMRTDSVTLANEAIEEIRSYIKKNHGDDFLPAKPVLYKTKSKNAQEAHEAIRPTSPTRTPESIKQYLNKDQYKLYNLIWLRTIACQMVPATINMVSVELKCGKQSYFRATGSTIKHPGYMQVYKESDDSKQNIISENQLPALKKGDAVDLKEILTEQHFTEPPPRYTEASLVKTLEEHGIGRPSTYASIIYTIQQREYVTLDKKKFFPTDVGKIVVKFLTQHFSKYVDYDFTAHLENQLDAISRGEHEWLPLLKDFWKPFHKQIETIDETVSRSDVTSEKIDEKCPECGKEMVIKLGRIGRFIGCTGYPDCSYTRNLNDDQSSEPETIPDRNCPECNEKLVIKVGRYGKFIGCSNYPNCKHIEPLEKPKDTGVKCPECKKGTILQRKSRRGKVFYSCSEYPKCKYALWNEPIKKKCSKCKWPIVTLKVTKRKGTEEICPNCNFSKVVVPPEK